MSGPAARLSAVDEAMAIRAIKALRAVTGGSLVWAKRDIYDAVRGGRTQTVALKDAVSAEHLSENGWYVTLIEGPVDFRATVPSGHVDALKAVVHALGGQVESA